MRKLSKILSVVINLFFYPLLAVILAALILYACGIKPYITMSGSMEPEIHTGSLCFVNTKAAYSEMEEGDVIAYRTATGGLVTHRIIEITEAGFETKGDANEVSDGVSTNAENFHGETLFSVPYAGYVIKCLQQPSTIAIIVILAVTSIIAGRILSKEEDEDTSERKRPNGSGTEKNESAH